MAGEIDRGVVPGTGVLNGSAIFGGRFSLFSLKLNIFASVVLDIALLEGLPIIDIQ